MRSIWREIVEASVTAGDAVSVPINCSLIKAKLASHERPTFCASLLKPALHPRQRKEGRKSEQRHIFSPTGESVQKRLNACLHTPDGAYRDATGMEFPETALGLMTPTATTQR